MPAQCPMIHPPPGTLRYEMKQLFLEFYRKLTDREADLEDDGVVILYTAYLAGATDALEKKFHVQS